MNDNVMKKGDIGYSISYPFSFDVFPSKKELNKYKFYDRPQPDL
jgi:hypothetical protein